MAQGTLEVLLVSAKGLENTDYLSGTDAYAVLICRTQEKKSSVASGDGSNPEWNETFLFTISDGITELKIKMMDKDTFTQDDLLAKLQSIPPVAYNVVKDEQYRGHVRVGLKFIPQRGRDREFCLEENFGGWKQSSMD
ncbi:hypothetical protein RD792_015721 [Penstemon davidsonii]|uniref:C2 domain-containing protein n=1 Tax=Penstemon davidsonii TaxID=160366 RepID=A0ABR0CIF9_9LAMI|nr:hypothetical protein RD792_015721 [Penstemon davidsonii]